MDKATWRQWAKAQRQSLPISAISAAICDHVAEWPVFQQAQTVLSFMALPTEVDLSDLQQRHPQKTWYVPRITTQGTMAFYRVTPDTVWVKSAWGILEPREDAPPLAPETGIDLILVPALAVDEAGNRLGYGKGYYDQFLAGLTPIPTTLCPVPSALVVHQLPADPWDQPLDFMACETGIISVSHRD